MAHVGHSDGVVGCAGLVGEEHVEQRVLVWPQVARPPKQSHGELVGLIPLLFGRFLDADQPPLGQVKQRCQTVLPANGLIEQPAGQRRGQIGGRLVEERVGLANGALVGARGGKDGDQAANQRRYGGGDPNPRPAILGLRLRLPDRRRVAEGTGGEVEPHNQRIAGRQVALGEDDLPITGGGVGFAGRHLQLALARGPGRVADRDGAGGDIVLVLVRQRLPVEHVAPVPLAHHAQGAVRQGKVLHDVGRRRQMPGNDDGVAVFDLHLTGAGSLRPGDAVNPGDDVGNAVGVVGRQLAEDEAKRAADEAEGDRLLDQ